MNKPFDFERGLLFSRLVEALSSSTPSMLAAKSGLTATDIERYANEQRRIEMIGDGRSPIEIKRAVYAGKLCERALALTLAQYFRVRENEHPKEFGYHWDLEVTSRSERASFLLEIKGQPMHSQDITFLRDRQHHECFIRWRKYDFMVLCHYSDMEIFPWIIMSAEAFDPERNLMRKLDSGRPGFCFRVLDLLKEDLAVRL